MSTHAAFFGLDIPFIRLVGAEAEHWERGRAVTALDVQPELNNSWGAAHGGVLMTLLDVTMGCAARSLDEQSAGVVTVDMHTSFLRAGTGRLVAEGRVLHAGRSLVFCEGEVRDAGGGLVARSSGTFRLRRRRQADDTATAYSEEQEIHG